MSTLLDGHRSVVIYLDSYDEAALLAYVKKMKLLGVTKTFDLYIVPPFSVNDGSLSLKCKEESFTTSTVLFKTIYQYFGEQAIIVLDKDAIDLKDSFIITHEEPHDSNGDLCAIEQFEEVCIGGTFDHFHLGHRLLVLSALLVTKNRLVVGLTDDVLLQKKEYKEFIEPYSVRKNSVIEFCKIHKPSVICDVHALKDIAGPAGWDPKLEAIVVTPETYKSVDIINQIRSEKGLNILKDRVIPLIESPEEMKKIRDDNKISSSTIRRMLALQIQQAHK